MSGDVDDLDTRLLAQGASIITALSGAANVVMQLSRPEIGHAVRDSVVTEGNLFTGRGSSSGDPADAAEPLPPDRDVFERFWRVGLAEASIDATMREYLLSVVRLEYLPRRVPRAVVRLRLWLATGYLPAELRRQLGLDWTPRQQRRFIRFNRAVGAVVRRLPQSRRAWPLTKGIDDVRARLLAQRDLFTG